GGDDAGGLVGSLAAVVGPVTRHLGVPHLGRVGLEVVDEVLGGARLVGAVHGGDGELGQFDALVLLGDGRVGPLGDLALEDLRDRGGVEVEAVDPLDVEDDGDGGDVGGDLDDGRAGHAAGEVVLGQLLVL